MEEIHAQEPLDAILVTGDLTDAGRSAEWAEFFDAFAPHPQLTLLIGLPGNHGVNGVDRANPARLDLPTSPKKRLRQVRTVLALAAIQGARVKVLDRISGRLGGTLDRPWSRISLKWSPSQTRNPSPVQALAALWPTIFPMVCAPDTEDGLGVIVLNSNAETHFSFTNALGMVSYAQAKAMTLLPNNTLALAGSLRFTTMSSSIPNRRRHCPSASVRL